jgi:hypothetical protein
VAEHGRIGDGEVSVAAVQVGMAHAAGDDFDQHLVGTRVGQVDILDHERRELLADDGGGDLHEECVSVGG